MIRCVVALSSEKRDVTSLPSLPELLSSFSVLELSAFPIVTIVGCITYCCSRSYCLMLVLSTFPSASAPLSPSLWEASVHMRLRLLHVPVEPARTWGSALSWASPALRRRKALLSAKRDSRTFERGLETFGMGHSLCKVLVRAGRSCIAAFCGLQN